MYTNKVVLAMLCWRPRPGKPIVQGLLRGLSQINSSLHLRFFFCQGNFRAHARTFYYVAREVRAKGLKPNTKKRKICMKMVAGETGLLKLCMCPSTIFRKVFAAAGIVPNGA